MKTARSLSVIVALGLLAATVHAGYIDEIKDSLDGPEIEGSPKYVALYFSAHWCPPCRMFTPKLVEWYKDFKPKHPNFELVFVSADRSEEEMDVYVKEDKMPWPYAKYNERDAENFRKYSSDGIPYLVLIGENGKDMTGKPGNEWQAPDDVLAEIEKIVGGS
ncbi:MAG: thioredoxin-like domain-containing protein [Chthoniobacterales bacterium]